jgi:enamine deaminase RidA (YjgF/YER057c/UK114 family)
LNTITTSRVASTAKWAEELAYSRAIRRGPNIWISGTVPVDTAGDVVGVEDSYVQAQHVLSIISAALIELNASLDDVVRTRVYLRDWQAKDGAAKAHREAFAHAMPAATFVLAGLVEPTMLVEIEVEAYVSNVPNSLLKRKQNERF